MARKIKKASSGKKNDVKIAGIIIALVFIVFLVFVLMHKSKEKQIEPKHGPVTVVPKKRIIAKPVVEAPIIKKLPPGKLGKIAFVIDDWGYTTRNCKYLIDIKVPIATAILPNLKKTAEVEKCSSAAGKVVMLHLPMEPFHNTDKYPDNYIISSKMNPNLVEKIIESALKKMPTAVGVNNHMGSKALESPMLMKLVLRILKKHDLFFVDSMTSPHHSVGREVADQVGIRFAQRDVFLDNINTREAILKQFDELISKTTKKGYAIAIGHDRELTMKVLKEQIPILQAKGFEIVSIKELLKTK